MPPTDDELEQAKASLRYEIERAAFRHALNKGNRTEARRLADQYDWPDDTIADELVSWLESK